METIKEEIVSKVLEKKELRSLNRDIAKRILLKDFPRRKYEAAETKEFNPRSKETKELVKELRRKLRNVHGVFYNTSLSSKKKKKLLRKLPDRKVLNQILETHVSTKERLHEAKYLYQQIEDYYDGYNTVCDIGCGYNPLFFLERENIEKVYFADLSDTDIEFLRDIYDVYGKAYEAKTINMINEVHREKVYEDVEGYDVAFCLKLFDSLEYLERDITKKILSSLLTLMKKGVIASFSRRTVSGKNFIETERYWFKELLSEFEVTQHVIETKNEKYILLKNE